MVQHREGPKEAETTALQKTLDWLTDKYENLHTRVGGDPTRGIAGLEDKVTALQIFVERWTPKLEGNGKKPLMTRLEAVEDWQAKKDKMDNQKITDNRDIRIAIMLMVVSSLWNIFGDWVKSSIGL